MDSLTKRVAKLPEIYICRFLGFNEKDTSFGMSGETRDMLNKKVVELFESEEIDEIELIIIESGE
jgi:hypothetical protein